MWHVAFGILIAVGIIAVVWACLSILVLAYVLLWHGIDDYGPLKHWWLDRRLR